MSRFNKEQYSHLRQSLRHMPPTNPVGDDARHRGPLGLGNNYLTHERRRLRKASHPIHNLIDLLHGKSIRNLTKRVRKEKECKGGRAMCEERDSDYSASLSYDVSSSSRMNPDSRDYCKQYSSLSDEPLDHQQQQDWARDTAYHETTQYSTGNCGDDVLTAEVSQGTFDVDYTKWNETERHPETLPTLQQHVEEKDCYHPDHLGPIQDTPVLPLREPSDRSIDIPGLLDDIILSSKEMGDSVSLTKTLHEMGLKDKLQQMLPEWAGDVLEAEEEDIDPEVLKELVLATVEERPAMQVKEDVALQHLVDEIKRRPSTDFAELEVDTFAELLRGKSTEEHRLVEDRAKTQAMHLKSPRDKSKAVQLAMKEMRPKQAPQYDKAHRLTSAAVSNQPAETKQPIEDCNAGQLAVQARKTRPSAVAHDCRGPIPPTNGIVGSFTSSASEPERARKSGEVSKVEEDTRGPIPNDGCAIPTSSAFECVGISMYDIHTPNETGSDGSSCSEGGSVGDRNGDGATRIRKDPPVSVGVGAKDPPGRYITSVGGSVGGSLRSAKEESESASLLRPSCSSDRERSMRVDGTLAEGVTSYPFVEEPPNDSPSPPQLRRMFSSSSFSSFDKREEPPHDAHTKTFLSPSYAHHSHEDEIRHATMRMRTIVLEEMRRTQISERWKRRPF